MSKSVDDVTGLTSTFSSPFSSSLLQHVLAPIGRHHHETRWSRESGHSKNALTGFDAIEARHLPVNKDYLVRLATFGAVPGEPSTASSPEAASSATKVMFRSMFDNTVRADELSSTIRTRLPQRSDRSKFGRVATTPLPRRAVNQKALPLPNSLVTSTSPPISSARRLEIASRATPYHRTYEL